MKLKIIQGIKSSKLRVNNSLENQGEINFYVAIWSEKTLTKDIKLNISPLHSKLFP